MPPSKETKSCTCLATLLLPLDAILPDNNASLHSLYLLVGKSDDLLIDIAWRDYPGERLVTCRSMTARVDQRGKHTGKVLRPGQSRKVFSTRLKRG